VRFVIKFSSIKYIEVYPSPFTSVTAHQNS